MEITFWLRSLATALPFLLLLALWFFLMRRLQAAKNQPSVEEMIEPIRQMLLRDVGPEIRSLRESVDALRAEIKASKDEVAQ